MLAWAIKHWRQGLYADTVRRTRAESVEAFKKLYGVSNAEWNEDRPRVVNRPVRVKVEVWTGH